MENRTMKQARKISLADLWETDVDEHAEWLRNKREDVAMTLCGMLAEKKVTRAKLARQLSRKPSWVSRALNGRENLTINTIGEIVRAAGYDFEILVRGQGALRALQPWEHASVTADILAMHATSKAMLATVAELNRASFRRARKNVEAPLKATQDICMEYYEENGYATVACEA